MSIPQVAGNRGNITVQIPVSDSLYNKFTNKEVILNIIIYIVLLIQLLIFYNLQHLSFTITAVFFNIGINEKATLAEALGETTPQYHSNNDNLDRLFKYYYKYNKIFPTDPTAPNRGIFCYTYLIISFNFLFM